ncbi:monocarboxylate transporter 12-like [Ornithodoros turicata]|uniref:monocarboxylate transporter 12-like n=1 Tax=Ornithodoros turicata TaxID=34597 RepID=UPI003138C9F9
MGQTSNNRRHDVYKDSARSWLVSVACTWCFFWTMIINRCGGIVFITLISEFGASRETASWPFSLLGAVSNLFGVVSGFMIKSIPLRIVSLLGCTLTAAGILLCALFYNVTTIILFIGIITAIGQGMIFPSNMVAINTFFVKYRASGSGISYVGATLVSFVFPPILLLLHSTYGLRGTFLIVGGLTLNAIAGSIFITRPEDLLKPQQRGTPLKVLNGTGSSSPGPEELSKPPQTLSSKFRANFVFVRRPIYYVIVITGVIYAYVLVLFNVTIVDYAVGKGFSKMESAMLLSCYGGGDLVGRIFSGQLSDRKVCRRRDVMALAFLLTSGAMTAISLSKSLAPLATSSFLFGLASGSTIILFSVLLVEYFGVEHLPLAIGMHCLVNGLAALPRPKLIGYYKDKGGSYEGLYTLLAATSLVVSLVWATECFLQWIRGRNRRRGSVAQDEQT